MINVEHISRLARIKLTEAEEEKFGKELSGILEFIAKLNQLDAKTGEALDDAADVESGMRPDAQDEKNSILEGRTPRLLDSAPARKGDWVRVKSVFEP